MSGRRLRLNHAQVAEEEEKQMKDYFSPCPRKHIKGSKRIVTHKISRSVDGEDDEFFEFLANFLKCGHEILEILIVKFHEGHHDQSCLGLIEALVK